MCSDSPTSCPVPENDELFRHYHDTEWGVPATTDQAFFEKICLEGFQSGLSWRVILHRRETLRQLFDHFDPLLLAYWQDSDVQRLLADERMIRNQRKIISVINNAKRFLAMQDNGESLAALCWSFEPTASHRPPRIDRQWLSNNARTAESTALATALKKRGFSYVGPTTQYALMQALGIVNDHVDGCPQRLRINELRMRMIRPVTVI